MSDTNNDVDNARFLAPPAVAALRQEARENNLQNRVAMERSLSEDIREEREDLKEAAEQSLNIIVDLDLEGRVKWVSPSWTEVIGTSMESIEGKPIADILVGDKNVFQEAVESMKRDDSRSHIVRFALRMGPNSFMRRKADQEREAGSPEEGPERTSGETETEAADESKGDQAGAAGADEKENDDDVLSMEGQGIMVFDGGAPDESHTMWMLRPSTEPREITIDLPPLLVESLGVGAEVLANYLTSLAESGVTDPTSHPLPAPVLCRICERQITPWWFEKHSDLCLQEHRAEMDVQMAQENLNEQRNSIVKVLDALEARQGRPTAGDASSPASQPEYKGLLIGPSSSQSSGQSSAQSSGSSSVGGTPPRSRDHSLSSNSGGHVRARSFAVRRPLSRIVELVLDLCDTALEINTPALKEGRAEAGEDFRTQSPQSESRISQVLGWQSPSRNTLEQEQGLAALSTDTESVAKAKVDAVLRHRRIVEYAERIRIEFTVLVEQCIAAAIAKAQRIAAGELSDSSSSVDEVEGEDPEPDQEDREPQEKVASEGGNSSSEAVTAMAAALRNPSDPAVSPRLERRSSSVAVSTRSSSPMECPTPRSHKSLAGLLSQSQPSKRGSLLAESDAGDSDSSSIPASVIPGAKRTESPSSEKGLTRATSTARDRKRKSLVLPGLSSSPRRHPSPARNSGPPHSPLRLSKPRLPSGDSMPSPNISPLLSSSDLLGYSYPHHHTHHHRRQSSAASSDHQKPPVSPRLTSSHPQPRAVAPSIKDFEIIKPISKGAFGSVYLSKKKSTGEYFAIKVLKKADMVAKNQVTNVKAERAIMMWQGESDFVAKLYWTFSSKDYLYLVMEYLNGGDCASLVKILGGLPEDWAKKYVAEVVLGVEHLHNRGIVHRDLKPDNLLIDQKGHLKLTDFGLSRMGLIGRQKRLLKSPNESAPDLLKQGPFVTRAPSMSITSSRSASFDYQGNYSPSSTPLITPDVAGSLSQPSYFNLNKDHPPKEPPPRELSRRASGYRSDSGGSDTLNAMFRTFSLHESGDLPMSLATGSQSGHAEETREDVRSEESDSPQLFPLQQTISSTGSASGQQSTPPPQPMMPPPMALFDPEDHNRRFVGTPDYLAPETINGVGQDEMSDWWSLGCILFEFLYGYPPFNASTPDEVFENILQRKINWPEEADELVTPEAKDLMNRLMTIDPKERLGSNKDEKFPNGGAEIRAHPWFADVNWETLLEDKAQFVPAPENPEDTEYFDARGATLQAFTEEMEDQLSPPATVSGATEYPDRPHDALFKVRSQVNSLKRGLMPLHIPPHVRDTRNRRLSEPAIADDFGNFNFKNLPILERANKDVIQKLRQEALQAQQRPVPTSVTQTPASSSGPSLEGSPLLPMPLQRTMSQNKGSANRPASPSSLSQANSSPSRPSQPSSPLLVQFSTGQNHERRKTSGSSSTTHSHTSNSYPGPSHAEQARGPASLKSGSSSTPSPMKPPRVSAPSPDKNGSAGQRTSVVAARARSQTVDSQDAEFQPTREPFVPGHYKRRSQLFDISPSSSDNEDPRAKALLKVQRRRQSSRRLSHVNPADGPFFRPLDVLICEDHPVSRFVMERLFEKLRCRTITAVNGAEAMRYAFSEVQFDLIMTEFKLPQINGADVARMVRETRSVNTHTPIIAVTGYLKDLPETHHFDALIEKPLTLPKLIEALSKFCQWRPAPKDYTPSQPVPIPPSALRQAASRVEDSPSSASSGFVAIPASSYRGSSRQDSIGSSYFGDFDSVKADDVPVIISRQATDEWAAGHGGLGISEENSSVGSNSLPVVPSLLHATSAPSTLTTGIQTPRKQMSSEGIRAKRESLEKKRYECVESGDDEDEELGDVQVRARSPQIKTNRSGSKLGTEMMRTNSRGSVVSGSEELLKKEREMMRQESQRLMDEQTPISRGLDTVDDQSEKTPLIEGNLERTARENTNIPPLDLSASEDLTTSHPPLQRYATEIRSPTDSFPSVRKDSSDARRVTKPEAGQTQKGHITPPIVFSHVPGAGPTEGLVEPNTVLSAEQSSPSPEAEGEDADATPRPAPTPTADLESEPTPRPAARSRERDRFMIWRRK